MPQQAVGTAFDEMFGREGVHGQAFSLENQKCHGPQHQEEPSKPYNTSKELGLVHFIAHLGFSCPGPKKEYSRDEDQK